MVAVANLQYGWTLLVHPLHDKYGWSLGSIQTAFAIFVIAETWLVPVEAWFVDRFGPRVVVMFGGVMIALAWVLRHPNVIAIPKAARELHVRQNAEAAAISLTPQDLAEIDHAFPPPRRAVPLAML